MTYTCLPFTALSIFHLYEILRLRSEVFVVEQTCIYQDIDHKDTVDGVHHLMLHNKHQLVAYARLLPSGPSYVTPSIGRVLVCPSARNQGLGRKIIQASIEQCLMLWPHQAITIGAQSHLSRLYQSYGFVEISNHYDEDGILHVDMQLEPKRGA